MRFEQIDVSIQELEQLVEQTGSGPLPPEGQQKLWAAVQTLRTLGELLAEHNTTIGELRELLLGQRTTEKTKKVLGNSRPDTAERNSSASKERGKRKGHGRNGVAHYRGATRITVAHPTLKRADRCPECLKGRIYPLGEPRSLVRIAGRPPLEATVYELESLHCNLCDAVFTPPAPDGGIEKYDFTAVAMIALRKYGSGIPF